MKKPKPKSAAEKRLEARRKGGKKTAAEKRMERLRGVNPARGD